MQNTENNKELFLIFSELIIKQKTIVAKLKRLGVFDENIQDDFSESNKLLREIYEECSSLSTTIYAQKRRNSELENQNKYLKENSTGLIQKFEFVMN